MFGVQPRMICPRCRVGQIGEESTTCPLCGHALSEPSTVSDAMVDMVQDGVRKELGREYQIEGVLGRGGMSIVFLAREMELNRLVALKVLPLQLSMGPDAQERFKREARIAASLDHPHIVPVFRVGTTGSLLWYSMKFVKGRSLSDVLPATGPMPLSDCLGIIEQAAAGLEYAHRRGVVHRDVKPANILIDETGWASVCDFGVAKAFGALPITLTGAALGTPGYMSPEQCYGRPLDAKSDQYSLAILTYECLAGTVPFTGDSLGEIVRKHCMDPPPHLTQVRPEVSERVADALDRAMRKQPEERFDSVTEFVAALGGTPTRITPTAMPAVTSAAALTGARTQEVPVVGRSGVRWTLLGVTTAALAVVLALIVWPQPAPTLGEPVGAPVVAAAPDAASENGAAWLSVNSEPWGMLIIDDRIIGNTPQLHVELTPGRHNLRIVQEGFAPYEQVVEIAAGDSVRLTGIQLKQTGR